MVLVPHTGIPVYLGWGKAIELFFCTVPYKHLLDVLYVCLTHEMPHLCACILCASVYTQMLASMCLYLGNSVAANKQDTLYEVNSERGPTSLADFRKEACVEDTHTHMSRYLPEYRQ